MASKVGKLARNTMYYKKPKDRELIREGDWQTEDAADPMETDGYGPDQGIGGWDGEPNFSVTLEAGQSDDLPPAGPDMPNPKKLVTKLRKKGSPKAAE